MTDTPNKSHWRSLDELDETPRFQAAREREFALDPTEIEIPPVDRRKFMGLLGATSALAGLGLSGCIRKPQEAILPFASRPEDLVPGTPRYYATAAWIAGAVEGLLVESQEGRPTKIEGNPEHPETQGATSARAQAEVLELYDVNRSRHVLEGGKPSDWNRFDAALAEQLATLKQRAGAGLAVLSEHRPSPTYRRLLAELKAQLPKAELYLSDAAFAANHHAAMGQAGRPRHLPVYALDRVKLLVTLDADILGFEGDAVRNARRYAKARSIKHPTDTMLRHYAAESYFTVTGSMADHRLALPSSQIAALLAATGRALLAAGFTFPEAASRLGVTLKGPPPLSDVVAERFATTVAKDLRVFAGQSLVVVGARQPAAVHLLALMLNAALGNLQKTVELYEDPDLPAHGSLAALTKSLAAGQVRTLLMIGGNPAYAAPADLDFAARMKRATTTIHLSTHVDETSARATWHLPRSHFLEAWGDLRASDGTLSIQQPLIAPLYATRSEIELVASLLGRKSTRGYELVFDHWKSSCPEDPAFTERWNRWLHDGVATLAEPAPRRAQGIDWALATAAYVAPEKASPPSVERLELDLRIDPSLFDGRYANNGWLQELPDPITKLTWDNALCLSESTAKALGVRAFDMVTVTSPQGGHTVDAAVFLAPGTADFTATLALGYGRTHGGEVLQKTGFDAYKLLLTGADGTPQYVAPGVKITKLKRRYLLATTQDHGSMEGRPLVREGTLEVFRKEPTFAEQMEEHPPLRSIWKVPNPQGGQQWGMAIDLNLCTGCSACTLACQAENNISVVGKRRVLEGREMHWLRIDRYYVGAPDAPRLVSQPMGCHHCELAPCEGVCPVAATVHSPEGLNDMAYNRCIGTRYCSNNCPYKVRRFNFFQYNKGLDPIARMQKNPDVTMRFRGVMEKCTYCVQRITEAKVAAKIAGHSLVQDGGVVPACAQVCPTGAIVFGNINDPASAIYQRKHDPRNYVMLAALNNRPRTSYLARLRNTNSELP